MHQSPRNIRGVSLIWRHYLISLIRPFKRTLSAKSTVPVLEEKLTLALQLNDSKVRFEIRFPVALDPQICYEASYIREVFMIQRQEYFSFCGVVKQGDSESRTKTWGAIVI